jgi:hypothetical protein
MSGRIIKVSKAENPDKPEMNNKFEQPNEKSPYRRQSSYDEHIIQSWFVGIPK